MAKDDHRRLAEPDSPHCLAMIEESRGHVIVGKAEDIGTAGERVVQRDKHILAVDQQRGEVVRHVVGKRDGKDCRCENRQQPG